MPVNKGLAVVKNKKFFLIKPHILNKPPAFPVADKIQIKGRATKYKNENKIIGRCLKISFCEMSNCQKEKLP